MARPAPAPVSGRNHAIDAVRLLAAFGVIVLHADFLQQAWGNSEFAIKLWFRWCVPFFFLAGGYFLPYGVRGPEVSWRRIGQVCLVTLFANLLYLPAAMLFVPERLTLSVIWAGTWFHLWFLMSLVAGLILLKLLRADLWPWRLQIAVSGLLLAGLVAVDFSSAVAGAPLTGLWWLRFLQAAPLMFCGHLLARFAPPGRRALRIGLGLLLSGLGLIAAQILYHGPPFRHIGRRSRQVPCSWRAGLCCWHAVPPPEACPVSDRPGRRWPCRSISIIRSS